MRNRIFSFVAMCSVAASVSFGVNITVAPTTGANGSNPTNTIADAIAQVNAGADVNNSITLRSTEGAHVLPDNTSWTFGAGKNVDFVAESGQPVVVLSWAAGQYMLTVNGDTAGAFNFTGIAFVPEAGLAYANNVGDGILLATGGTYDFTNCVFSSNNGSNGVASQEGAVAFVQPPAGNNVGDDWFVFDEVSASFSNCTITGANDDALVTLAAASAETLTIDQGTCIANLGGAGVNISGANWTLTMDGSAGRVQVADVGKRTGAADAGVKFFWDAGIVCNINDTDIINATNAAFYDFEGVTPINITDSRLAMSNSGNATPAGLFFVDDISNDSAYASTINLTRVTFHDALGPAGDENIGIVDGASEPTPTFNIIDSIFSGAGDTFDMRNTGAGATNQTFTAVVTAGAHAVQAVGDMGAGAVSADPAYASTTYTIGRNQSNANFLLPTDAAYTAASSGSGLLDGGAPGGPSSVADWSIY